MALYAQSETIELPGKAGSTRNKSVIAEEQVVSEVGRGKNIFLVLKFELLRCSKAHHIIRLRH